MQHERDVTVHLAFAFDVGYEIDLERARALVPGVAGPPPRRRRTPESIRYRPAPVRIPVDDPAIRLPGGVRPAGPVRGELSLFDFGAASLMVSWPLRCDDDALLDLAGELAEPAPLTAAARAILAPWLDRVRPAIAEFAVGDQSEEFVIFQIGEVPPGWLEDHAPWVAGLVRLDAGPLSAQEVAEATRLNLSYAPNDLVVLDWAAGLVADRECADTLQVLEFANVQLLEFRAIDDRLDDRLEAAYTTIHPDQARARPRWAGGWRSHAQAVRAVRELELEATSLIERTENALKLIGDQYLARIFGLASSRFHLDGWQRSIRRKLETAGDVYDLLVEQAGSRRMEALELIVVLLIALEIVLALFRH
jgi:hypothetical protein